MRHFILALLLVAAPAAVAAAERTDLNIVVALDRSESISAEDRIVQIQGLVYALTHPRFLAAVGSGIHGRLGFAVVKWSSFARSEVLVPWTVIAGRADAEAVATRLYTSLKRRSAAPDGSQTDVALGIEVAADMLATAPYDAIRQVINIVADGTSNIGRLPSVARDAALAKDVTINALVMGQGSAVRVLTEYFEREVIGGPAAFVHHAPDTAAFAEAMLRKMVLEVARLNALGRPGSR